jgi:DUF4097 and DUF4098 domain-containing protein YvlB
VSPQLRADHDCDHTMKRFASVPVAGVQSIRVIARAGTLDVRGASGVSEITINGLACASSADLLQEIRIGGGVAGGVLTIEAVIPETSVVVFGHRYAKLDLEILVPEAISMQVEDGSGSLRIENIGNLDLTDGSGSATIERISGSATIKDGSGSLTIRDVAGSVRVKDGSGSLTISSVRGDVTIDDGSGSIDVADIGGSVHVESDGSGGMQIVRVERDVRIDRDGSGGIRVSDVRGNFLVARDGSGGIEYDRVAGRVELPAR